VKKTLFRTLQVGLALILMILTGCVSPRVKGYKTKPYTIRGIHYQPMQARQALGYGDSGICSHYDESGLIFPGRTSTGEKIWPWTRAAAHKTLPLPCKIRVTNLKNGRSTTVRLNDRGPFIAGRMLDVTKPVARELGFVNQGLTTVKIKVLSVGDGSYRIR
jgi:rare lipoprotein A